MLSLSAISHLQKEITSEKVEWKNIEIHEKKTSSYGSYLSFPVFSQLCKFTNEEIEKESYRIWSTLTMSGKFANVLNLLLYQIHSEESFYLCEYSIGTPLSKKISLLKKEICCNLFFQLYLGITEIYFATSSVPVYLPLRHILLRTFPSSHSFSIGRKKAITSTLCQIYNFRWFEKVEERRKADTKITIILLSLLHSLFENHPKIISSFCSTFSLPSISYLPPSASFDDHFYLSLPSEKEILLWFESLKLNIFPSDARDIQYINPFDIVPLKMKEERKKKERKEKKKEKEEKISSCNRYSVLENVDESDNF